MNHRFTGLRLCPVSDEEVFDLYITGTHFRNIYASMRESQRSLVKKMYSSFPSGYESDLVTKTETLITHAKLGGERMGRSFMEMLASPSINDPILILPNQMREQRNEF